MKYACRASHCVFVSKPLNRPLRNRALRGVRESKPDTFFLSVVRCITVLLPSGPAQVTRVLLVRRR